MQIKGMKARCEIVVDRGYLRIPSPSIGAPAPGIGMPDLDHSEPISV